MPPAGETQARELSGPAAGRLAGLLLDIGGVVHSTAMHLVGRLAETEPAMKPVLERIGGIAGDRDELWQQMLRRQVTEREYWAQRAAEFGAAVGQPWDTRAMMHRLYELPRQDWLRAEMVDLMAAAKAAGLRLGALTNDMTAFHGPGWIGSSWPDTRTPSAVMPPAAEPMTAVRVRWDDPGEAIQAARDLFGLPSRR